MSIKSNPLDVQNSINLASFQVPFMSSSLNLAIPFITKDFSLSAFNQTFIISAYLVTAAMFQLPAARAAEILGRRKVFLVGTCVFGFFTMMGGLSWSGGSLIAFRIGAGLGSAMVYATNLAILTSVFPKERRGKALGLNNAVVYTSMAMGPFLGGIISQYLGWRAIFFICAATVFAAGYIALRVIKDEWRAGEGEPFDYRGGAACVLGMGSIVLGFSYLPSTLGWTTLAVGVIATAAFVHLTKGAAYPVARLDLFFKNRMFRLSSLSAMINYSASFAIGFSVSLYLQFVKGMSADAAGLLLMAQPVSQALLSPLAGKMSDRYNSSVLATIGMGVVAAGLLTLSRLTPDTPLALVGAVLAAVGVGFAIFSAPNMNIIMGSAGSRNAGLASATTGAARMLGQSLSIAIASLVVHAYMGDEKLTLDNANLFLSSIKTAFLVFGSICLCGVYTSGAKLFGSKANGDGEEPEATGEETVATRR